MLNGWVSLDRAMLDHWCASDPLVLAVWVRLLLEANHADKKRMFNGVLMEVKRGQLVFGYPAFAKKSGVTVNQLRRIIGQLENDNMIHRQKTNKFSLISITNYDEYQKENRQTTGKPQSEHSQSTGKPQHRNNDNNANNETSKELLPSAKPDEAQAAFDYWCYRMGKGSQTKFSPKRRKAVQGRLKEGRTLNDLKNAIDGCAASEFHMGQGQRSDGTVYNDLELICRNNEKLEQFMQLRQTNASTIKDAGSGLAQMQKMAKEDPFL